VCSYETLSGTMCSISPSKSFAAVQSNYCWSMSLTSPSATSLNSVASANECFARARAPTARSTASRMVIARPSGLSAVTAFELRMEIGAPTGCDGPYAGALVPVVGDILEVQAVFVCEGNERRVSASG
jgi:hypothetical protein